MSDQTPPSQDALQFDQVEVVGSPSAPGAACTACQQPVTGYYYQVNGGVVCVPCREKLAAMLASGSGLWRLIKAIVFGVAAAAAGAGLYFAVLKLTGYQFALIAIVVGIMVGMAVRAGSESRGGWLYQIIAVLLTYLAMASTFVPFLYEDLESGAVTEVRKELASAPAGSEARANLEFQARVEGDQVRLTSAYKGILMVLAAVGAVFFPFLEFDLILYIIIGVGLYEAGKLTRRARFDVTGPFTVHAPSAASPPMVSTPS